MTEILIPSVGIAMEEALIVKWVKEPGDRVEIDDVVAEIETDKATMDLVSPAAGTLGPHLFEPGSIVPVGAAIAHVLSGAAVGSEPLDSQLDSRTDDSPGSGAVAEAAAEAEPAVALEGERPRHVLSPRARRLAQERGAATAAAPGEVPATDAARGRFRDVIAVRVSESWREIPHFTVSREVDAEPIQAALAEERAQGLSPSPTFTDLLLRALAVALSETGAEPPVDLGLAVATTDGVLIPVVEDVLGRSVAELARAREEAVARGRAGKLSQSDLAATPRSTLSNLGSFGVDRFTGIIALGQKSLLTVGRARPRVVADEDGAIRVKTTFDATLNADHRTMDGADAARLLAAFAAAAEGTPSAF